MKPSLESRSEFESDCWIYRACKVRILQDYWIYVDPVDLSLTPDLMRDGYWESWLSLAVARVIQPGWYCVDIGANVGYYTVLMMAHGADFVLAVEPQPDIARLLHKTVESQHWSDKVEVSQVALGADEKRVVLHRYGDKTGSTSIIEVPGYDVTQRILVPGNTLDNLVDAAWPHLDFIKIDAEGAEFEIWKGMKDTLAAYSPIVMMEVDDDRGYDRHEFMSLIKADGYKVRFVSEDGSIVEAYNGRWQKGGWTTLWLTR